MTNNIKFMLLGRKCPSLVFSVAQFVFLTERNRGKFFRRVALKLKIIHFSGTFAVSYEHIIRFANIYTTRPRKILRLFLYSVHV